jgi:hypothetical protein
MPTISPICQSRLVTFAVMKPPYCQPIGVLITLFLRGKTRWPVDLIRIAFARVLMVKSVAISLRGLMGCRRKAGPAGFSLVGDLGELLPLVTPSVTRRGISLHCSRKDSR